MGKLIDADELKAKAFGKRGGLIHTSDIDDAPTVDAVEVVRCKDCKHWYSDADTGMACEFTNMGQPDDGFCNWGERKDGEQNG